MIEFHDVSFGYGERMVLKNITFRLDESESVIIMGPSGSGKSTALRLILGLVFPRSGQVLVEGVDLSRIKESERREVRKRIGMVFQDGALFDSLTVGENVGYYLFEHSTLDESEIEDKVREMLGFVGLDPDQIIDRLPEELSGGMQRRVAIGRALLSTDPQIMLYDEPTTGLDPQSTDNVLWLINKLTHEKAISTIVVTHQIADAIALANRFMIIHGGELAFDGTLDQLRVTSDPRVVEFLQPFRDSFQLVADKQLVVR